MKSGDVVGSIFAAVVVSYIGLTAVSALGKRGMTKGCNSELSHDAMASVGPSMRDPRFFSIYNGLSKDKPTKSDQACVAAQ